jgi:sortase A
MNTFSVSQSALRRATKRTLWRALELALWLVGVALLLTYGAARTWSFHQQQAGLEQFAAARTQESAGAMIVPATMPVLPDPDRTLWSAQRSRAYDTGNVRTAPLGVLRIPSINLAVPIYEGTADSTLDRGAGRIEGTAQLDELGNVGIAAHRDGFFRALKDIDVGAELTLQTLQGDRRYRVTRLLVTDPADVAVIGKTPTAVVTLVTCYPFYFVGSAPQRFIVRAEPIAP